MTSEYFPSLLAFPHSLLTIQNILGALSVLGAPSVVAIGDCYRHPNKKKAVLLEKWPTSGSKTVRLFGGGGNKTSSLALDTKFRGSGVVIGRLSLAFVVKAST